MSGGDTSNTGLFTTAEALKERLNKLETRMDALERKHGGRLDEHEEAITDLRKSFAQIQSDVSRMFGILTSQAMVMERVDKGMTTVLEYVRSRP